MSSSVGHTRLPVCGGRGCAADGWRCRDGFARAGVPSGCAELEADAPQGRLGQLRHRQFDAAEIEHRRRFDARQGDALVSSPRRTRGLAVFERRSRAVGDGKPETDFLARPVAQRAPISARSPCRVLMMWNSSWKTRGLRRMSSRPFDSQWQSCSSVIT